MQITVVHVHSISYVVFNFLQSEGEAGEPYFRRLVLRSVAHIIRPYSSSLITECEVLDHCYTENWKIYHDLNAYRILFDEGSRFNTVHYQETGVPLTYGIFQEGDPRLSSFGLMKNSRDGKCYSANLAYTPPEFLQNDKLHDVRCWHLRA
ncbi:hypothetical protein Pint_12124 [Pistacia integerrima]|uniref:Uncharacterized protein n=1 Tax=Pistacia integerrima TaxID=434235 RepID=A0ACC0XNS2_9ROSI|nr:hypothetical protein Pint_12124 [Pistacia integerrima]